LDDDAPAAKAAPRAPPAVRDERREDEAELVVEATDDRRLDGRSE
jgi:hypothetical protein